MKVAMLCLILALSNFLAEAQTRPDVQNKPGPYIVPATTIFTELECQVDKLQGNLEKEPVAISESKSESSAKVKTSSASSAKTARISPAQMSALLSRTSQLKALLKRTEKIVETLKKLSKKKNIPEEYAESIREYTRRMEILNGKETISNQDEAFLLAINADLEVKKIHAEKRPENGFDSINIVVHTKKNGGETGVYQVWWVKDAYKDEVNKYQTFDRFSTPTNRPLPPGKYLMWTKATDGTQTTSQKEPKEFGDGKGEVEVDLIAP
jgi:hypothetical protein